MNIAIIDYGSGNLHSVANAFEQVSDTPPQVTNKPDIVERADYIVLPGVGAFAECAAGLAAIDGMIAALTKCVIDNARPFLGICVGMQLLCERGLEDGIYQGLGWIKGDVVSIVGTDRKIPHIGWNNLCLKSDHEVLTGLDGEDMYFVHSYAPCPKMPSSILAEVDYHGMLTAVIGRDNIIGTQFHPEKSQAAGLRLLAQFLAWRP